MKPPSPDEQVKFAAHLKPMFRTRDKLWMRFKFDLGSYNDVSARADRTLERLRNGSMPCDGAWPPEQVDVFDRWIRSGKQP